MAGDPRTIDFEGIDGEYATYLIDNSTITFANRASTVGLAVTLSADGTVALTQDGNAVEGKLNLVHANLTCRVQVGGYCALPAGASASVTRGKKIVGALGAASARGYIREVATATAAELGVARGRIVTNGTTTAVMVDLD